MSVPSNVGHNVPASWHIASISRFGVEAPDNVSVEVEELSTHSYDYVEESYTDLDKTVASGPLVGVYSIGVPGITGCTCFVVSSSGHGAHVVDGAVTGA